MNPTTNDFTIRNVHGVEVTFDRVAWRKFTQSSLDHLTHSGRTTTFCGLPLPHPAVEVEPSGRVCGRCVKVAKS